MKEIKTRLRLEPCDVWKDTRQNSPKTTFYVAMQTPTIKEPVLWTKTWKLQKRRQFHLAAFPKGLPEESERLCGGSSKRPDSPETRWRPEVLELSTEEATTGKSFHHNGGNLNWLWKWGKKRDLETETPDFLAWQWNLRPNRNKWILLLPDLGPFVVRPLFAASLPGKRSC